MNTRKLGQGGLEVSEVGLGCMGMSEFYGPSEDGRSIETLHHAIGRAAAASVSLPKEILAELNSVPLSALVAGDRYPQASMALIER